MSNTDNLQKVKEALRLQKRAFPKNTIINLYVHEVEGIIAQLEQAQTTIEEQKLNYVDLDKELERINNNLFDACKQFEQAQAENEVLNRKNEQYRLSNLNNKRLQAENEQLKADKQKLVEVVEWYRTAGESDFHRDCGDRAMYVLREVKGNG